MRLYHQLPRFDPRAHFVVWLNSVARNYCIDRYRARVRERQRLLPHDGPMDRWAGEAAPGPERALELRETRDQLWDALESLSPRLREVVQLRFFQDLSYEEIGERLGVPEGTVKSRIHRGRAEMRTKLREAQRPPADTGVDEDNAGRRSPATEAEP